MAQSAQSDPYLVQNQTAADPYTGAVATVDPYTGETSGGPTSSATGDFLKRFIKSSADAASSTLAGAARIIPRVEQALGASKELAENNFPSAVSSAILNTASGLYKEVGDVIQPDAARDAGIPAMAANVIGSLGPVVAAGPAAPIALAAQIAENERQRAVAQGESEDIANARYDLGLSVGLPVALTPIGIGGRATAGVAERVATKAAIGGALGFGGDAALQAVQQRDFDGRESLLNTLMGAGGAAFMGLAERPSGPLAQEAPPVIDHEANIQAIADSTGKPIDQVRADYYAERGITAPEPPAAEPPNADDEAIKSAKQSAEVLDQIPIKNAEDSAKAFQSQEAIDSAGDGNLERMMAANQGTSPEVSPDPAAVQQKAFETPAPVAETDTGPELSPQASRMMEQYGGIDPRVMLAFGRTAIGGAAGYFTGDTPDEKIRDAIIGAGLAFGLPHIADALLKTSGGKAIQEMLVNESRDFWKRVDPLVLLPTQATDAFGNVKPLRSLVRETFGEGTAAESAIVGMGTAIAKDLDRSITGDSQQRGQLKRLVQSYLTGDAQAKQQIGPQLPAPVYANALRARYFIDNLTDNLISRGVVQGNMAQTMLSNMGQYLRRSYDIFSNPSFKVDPVKTQAAIDAVHQEMIAAATVKGNPAPARSEAESLIAALIDKHTRDGAQDFLYGRGKLAGKDVSVLIKRQDLMPEIRSLLGEISDPIFNIRETGTRMARLLEADRTQKNLAVIGQSMGLFQTTRDLKFSRELATTDRHSNYNGLYAEPHIADAFGKVAAGGRIDGLGSLMGEVLSRQGVVGKILGPPTYAAKFAATAMNPISWVPNFLHGAVANVMNGNFRFDYAKKAMLLGAEETGLLRRAFPNSPSRLALQGELAYLTKQRVFGQNLVSADLADVLQNNLYGKLKNGTVRTLSLFGTPDRLNDHFNKYVAFKSEQAKLAWAMPGTAPEKIADMAAARIRDTLPTYSKIPEIIKGASRAAMLAQFVSFPVELLRNTAQSYKYGAQDIAQGMQTKNSRLVSLGAQRLATMTAGLAAASAFGISAMARIKAGVSKEEDRALRELSPSWIKTAELLYDSPVTKDQQTGHPTIGYSNMSYLLAYTEVMQPLNMAVKELQAGGDLSAATKAMMRTISERFLGSSMMLPAVVGAITGVDLEKKKPIPATDIEPTIGDRAAFLASKLQPGFVRWAEQTAKAIDNQEVAYGQKFDLNSQLLKLGAVRRQVTDIPVSVDYRSRDLSDQLDRANQIYRSAVPKNLAPDELEKRYGLAQAARQKTLTQLRATYDAAVTLGMNEDDVLKSMLKSRIDPRDILAVSDNKYRAQDRAGAPTVSEIYATLQGLAPQQQQAKIAAIYKDDPGMGRTIMELYRQDVRGMTEKDKIIGRLGVNNGERADYLREQLAAQPTPQARQLFIQDMARRRLLSPLIMNQMATPPK